MREGNELGPLALARTPQCVACELLHKEDYRSAQSNLGMCTLIDSICTPFTEVGVESHFFHRGGSLGFWDVAGESSRCGRLRTLS